MLIIAIRELRSLFHSTLAWIIIALIQLVLAWVFAVMVYTYMQPDVQMRLANSESIVGVTELVIGAWFNWLAIVLLLTTPLFTMNLISEEKRNKTLTLLKTAPISLTEIVLGKFIAILAFFLILLAVLLLMPLSLSLGTSLDFGQISSAILGIILLFSSFVAVGLFFSSLTEHPLIAAISTLTFLLILWMIDWSSFSEEQSGLLSYISIVNHYHLLMRGLLDTASILYYGLLSSFFLMLTIQKLESERLH